MAQSHDDLEPSVYGIGEIENHSWQNSTIEACTNTFNSMCIIISPSQFRRLLSPKCRSEAVRSARYIVQTIRMYIGSKKIIILIADEIQKFNIAVFQPKNKNHSLNMALAEGRKIADIFSEAFQQLRVDDSQEIKILCWNDIVRSSNYNERVEQIQQYVNNNESECGRLIDKVRENICGLQNSIQIRKFSHVNENHHFILSIETNLINERYLRNSDLDFYHGFKRSMIICFH